MTQRQLVESADAPPALGPYSQAIKAGDLLFCAGQLGVDPSSGELVKTDAPGQARQCLENLAAVCRAAGARLGDAVRVTLYLEDIADLARVNEAYAEFFERQPPARVAVQVAGLPRGAAIEIDAVVAL